MQMGTRTGTSRSARPDRRHAPSQGCGLPLVAELPGYYFIANSWNLAPDVRYPLASSRRQADGRFAPDGRHDRGSIGDLAMNGNGYRSVPLPT